jgi:undecaprenyl diphosphate synthase
MATEPSDTARLPSHVGIIMDGNGRWAQQRNLVRSAGHREGLKAAKRIVRAASELGLSFLTLYTFSTENWSRTVDEVGFLMKLIGQNLKKEYDFYRENRIRVVHSGNLDALPDIVRKEIDDVMRDTASFDGLVVNLAINYGGRDEIVRSVNRWLRKQNGNRSEVVEFSEAALREGLDHPDVPDPDLIIRTAGEKRLSNFLLWESAYSEYFFSTKLWPDWTGEDLVEAIESFAGRNRKYGGVR